MKKNSQGRTRVQIEQYIAANPGSTKADIARGTGRTQGAVEYHLGFLSRQEKVTSKRGFRQPARYTAQAAPAPAREPAPESAPEPAPPPEPAAPVDAADTLGARLGAIMGRLAAGIAADMLVAFEAELRRRALCPAQYPDRDVP